MELVVELESASMTLADPDDTKRLSVRVAGPPGAAPATHAERLGRVLSGLHFGRLGEDGDARLDRGALRFRAAGQVGDDWDDRFEGMCRYAESKGWVDPGDGALQAHVEWTTGPPTITPPTTGPLP